MDDNYRFITVKQAAHYLGISRQATWGLVRRGALAARITQVGKRKQILVNRSSLLRLLADPTYANLTRRKDREAFAANLKRENNAPPQTPN